MLSETANYNLKASAVCHYLTEVLDHRICFVQQVMAKEGLLVIRIAINLNKLNPLAPSANIIFNKKDYVNVLYLLCLFCQRCRDGSTLAKCWAKTPPMLPRLNPGLTSMLLIRINQLHVHAPALRPIQPVRIPQGKANHGKEHEHTIKDIHCPLM